MVSSAPEKIRLAWRGNCGPDIRARRRVAGLSLFSGALMAGIALYQLRITHRIPEPRSRYLDAQRIASSPEAYRILRTPDALLGVLSYAATGCIAAAGAPDRAKTAPWIAVGAGAKLLADAAISLAFSVRQWTRYRAFCSWCLIACAATVTAAAIGAPEAVRAAGQLINPSRHG